MQLKLRSFVVMATVIFIGFLLGNWIGDVIGLNASDPFGAFARYFIPIVIVWFIWYKWGRKVAEE